MRMSHFTLLIFYQSLRSSDLSHFYNLSFNICLFFLSVFPSKISCFSSNKTLKLIFWGKISYLSFYTSKKSRKHEKNWAFTEWVGIHLLACNQMCYSLILWLEQLKSRDLKCWQISYIEFTRCFFSIVKFLWKSINFKICNVILLII